MSKRIGVSVPTVRQAYIELERQDEARVEAAEIVRLSPQFSSETWRERIPYNDQVTLERIIEGLRKAGLK